MEQRTRKEHETYINRRVRILFLVSGPLLAAAELDPEL